MTIWTIILSFLLTTLLVSQLVSSIPCARQTIGDPEITSYRLPNDLKAYLYDLQLRTFVGDFSNSTKYKSKSFKFDGRLDFIFRCENATSRIVLHSRDLLIKKDSVKLVRYSNSNDGAYESKNLGSAEAVALDKDWAIDDKRDFVIFYFDKKSNAKCSKGSFYKLTLNYSGEILEKPYGLFRNSFVDKSGKLNHLAATQFASLDARRMFPGLDEPAQRAEFDISIIRPKYLNSQSNMPLARTESFVDDPDWEVDYFERSLKMSTYLLAIVVSNFKKITKYTDKYKILVEITARPDAIDANETSYALNDAVKIIDFYSDYFNITYPLKKSTHAGLPDFITGAMENWGIIICKEIWLVTDPARDSIDRVKKVTSVLSHELAHQWFGDLVTMNWWNELWLNEGFASWIKYLGFNKTHPEWEMLDYFFIQSLNPMKLDSYESSRPVTFREADISTPNEVNSVFDPISYYKPGSILRMLNEYLGYETFRKSLSNYLKKYQFGNTRQDDLFEEIDKQAHLDKALSDDLKMKAIMDTWTLKMGYPVVNLTKTLKSSDSSYRICMTQEWFLINPLNKQNKSSKQFKEYKWYIPINYMLKSDKTSANSNKNLHWLKPEAAEYCLDTKPANDDQTPLSQNWIIANLKFMGFFRVNYDLDNWNLLVDQLNQDPKKVERISRAQLIDDAFYLGKGEYIDQLIFLRMIGFLRANESEYMPYITAFEGLNYIRAMLANDYLGAKAFKNFIRKFLRPTYNRLYWNTSLTDTNDMALQMAVLELMCLSDDEDCIKIANTYYDSWINLKTNLPNNFQNIILKTRVKYGSEKDWFDILEIAKKTNTLTAKLNYLSMLAFTRDINLVKLLLDYSTDPDVLPAQSQNEIILVLGQNPWSRTVLYDYMVKNWELLLKKYDNLPFTLRDLVRAVMANVNTRYEYERLKEFVRKNENNLGVATAEFKLSYEIIETNVRWMDTNYAKVRDYLSKY